MAFSELMIERLDEHLSEASAKQTQVAQKILDRGDVLNLHWNISQRRWHAAVRDRETYHLALEWTEEEWFCECSCGRVACKHALATMMALHDLGLQETASDHGLAKGTSSKLATAMAEHLGAPLKKEETKFLQRIKKLYADAHSSSLSENDLTSLSTTAGKSNYSWNGYDRVELWGSFPKDDLQFWLYIAHELKRRNLRWPAFMDGVTDFTPIEGPLRDWHRQKQVRSWNRRFEAARHKPPQQQWVQLRLLLAQIDARLQWRSSPEAEFADLKATHAKQLGERFRAGELQIEADSTALWSGAFKPWEYESWWSFKYTDACDRPALNRLLRAELSPERVVDRDGHPVQRHPAPLRLELRPPAPGSWDYHLSLVTADGACPPRILCILQGNPAIYVTEDGIYLGPPQELLGQQTSEAIPKEAVENAVALDYIQAIGVPLPAPLQEKIRSEPLKATINCKLEPYFSGSPVEAISLEVCTHSRSLGKEIFTPHGWQAASGDTAHPSSDQHILVPDRAVQRHFPALLEPLTFRWDDYSGCWKTRVTKRTPELFVSWLESLPEEIELVLDRQLATLRSHPVSGSVALDIEEAELDWFNLKVKLSVEETTLTAAELDLLLKADGHFVRLGKKGWRRLQFNLSEQEVEQLARLGLSARDLGDEAQRFHVRQLAAGGAHNFLPEERLQLIQRRAEELQARVAPELPKAISAQLRPYQLEGYHFLAYLSANRFGGVLADDMGLGKTLQTLTWLAWLREQNPKQPALVICPKSVVENWHSEAKRFYGDLRVVIWRGEPASALATTRENADLIVLNYPQLRALSPQIAEHPWLAVILDEAQAIKNPNSQTAQAARALKAGHRLALTGTPIENKLLDLWSILSFAMPGVLGNRSQFLRRFDAKDDPLARQRLSARVRPFLIRRAKAQVATDLPDRVEEDLLCELEGHQLTLYRAELKRARQILLGLKNNTQLNRERFNLLTSMLRLRQICCHPALVDESLRSAESAKLTALEELLEPLVEEGHKVLVFSQFVTMLELIREMVQRRNWPHYYLVGETENRGEIVRQFQTAADGAIFLISLKAGGFGLNLTAASYVVLFDPWWNPAVENQAIDRTHRIGQTSKVIAYRLLMRESIEQKIRLLQTKKAALAEDVLGEERFSQSLTLEDLRFLFAD